ncbi:hypothetical protein [Streptomyces sp. NPDC056987]|uniref:hypothetical protein n=1 Tax=Streptomyces sp. NPDC056987 TaxID=3345988 RepID=UPI00364080E8
MTNRRRNKQRKAPAVIRRRVEPDPVDVVLDPVATPEATPRHDATAPRDTTPTADASLPEGDTDSADDGPARRDTATRDADRAASDSDSTTRDSSDKATERQDDRATRVTPGSGDATPGRDTRADDTEESRGDMAPTATAGAGATAASAASAASAGEEGNGAKPGEVIKEAVKSTSFSLPPSLIARLRSAQWHTQVQPDGYYNISELVRHVINNEVTRLERAYNGGQPFPAVGRLSTGPSPRGAVRGAEIRALNRQRKTAARSIQEQEEAGGE